MIFWTRNTSVGQTAVHRPHLRQSSETLTEAPSIVMASTGQTSRHLLHTSWFSDETRAQKMEFERGRLL